jgi:hypothetical protein
VGSSERRVKLFQKRVATISEQKVGTVSMLPTPYAIRCVFWHPVKTLRDRSWAGRSRLHDAVIYGICKGVKLPEHLISGVLFSWVPSEEKPHALIDIQRLQWTNDITVPTIE